MKEQNQISEAAVYAAKREVANLAEREDSSRRKPQGYYVQSAIDAATAEVKKEEKDSGFADNTDAVHSNSREQTGLTFRALRVANVARYKDYPCDDWTLTDWGCCIAGEVGETCNLLKKLKLGKEIDKAEIAKEIADIIIYCDILSEKLGFDLGQITGAKFNEVSARIGSQVLLGSEVPTQKAPTDSSRKQEASLAARVEPTKELLCKIRTLLEGSPIDCLGTGCDPSDGLTWPIRDEVIDSINKVLSVAASCAVKEEEESL